MASVIMHNLTVIKHNMFKLTVSTEFCVKAPCSRGAYESVRKGLWAEVLWCVSQTTVVWDIVDPGPCCYLGFKAQSLNLTQVNRTDVTKSIDMAYHLKSIMQKLTW